MIRVALKRIKPREREREREMLTHQLNNDNKTSQHDLMCHIEEIAS